jgi:hypothetical protein
MERMTRRNEPDGRATVEESRIVRDGAEIRGEAVERLARFEDAVAELEADQGDVSLQLERMRGEGRSKTVRFRELMGRKLTNQFLLVLLSKHGIE